MKTGDGNKENTMPTITVYKHHDEPMHVWDDLKGLHRQIGRCWNCNKFHPKDHSKSCSIATELYETCVEYGLAAPVLACRYRQTEPDLPLDQQAHDVSEEYDQRSLCNYCVNCLDGAECEALDAVTEIEMTQDVTIAVLECALFVPRPEIDVHWDDVMPYWAQED